VSARPATRRSLSARSGELTIAALAPDGRSLIGRTVRLDAAVPGDADELFGALDHDEVWAARYMPKGRIGAPEGWRRAIESARDEQRAMYVVRTFGEHPQPGQVVGTTSLGDVDVENEKVHLGWTAYSPEVWGTSVNPECKLLLLQHAFEDCGFGRVKLRTDLVNTRSQAAIAKLGATREGVARRHIKRGDGTWRDSVIFSVIIDDWAVVKAGLQDRLASLEAPIAHK
jgi:RimJ/RimL family protein N-acetyltransferase